MTTESTTRTATREQLRLTMGEIQVADVRAQVMLSLYTDFENFTTFKPAAMHEANVNAMLDQLIAWGSALRVPRAKTGDGAQRRRETAEAR